MNCPRLHCTVQILLLIGLGLCNLPAVAGNALAGNPSPYLAMHAQDPVAWRTWSPAVLAEAQRTGKPLFISSGYFACHWCHVMQRESYRNPEIAARLNRSFIPVKLDRELHPALDAYLIGFVERTAGWPLNAFLTPDGYPLLGLTYAPPEQFAALLERVSRIWEKDSGSLADLARTAAQERVRDRLPPRSSEVASVSPRQLGDRLQRQALASGDELAGGFGHQARFPMAPTLSALLELQARTPNKELAAFLRLTLDAMKRGGLRDHLGGGFFRYTVDPGWQTPHFEKMLYTQALLASLYLRAAEVMDAPDFREVARDTLDFVLSAMRGNDGAYIASLSAVDADGVEGGFYLWRREELQTLLDADEQRLLTHIWGVPEAPAQDPVNLLMGERNPEHAATAMNLSTRQVDTLLVSAKTKLLTARSRRSLPRDDKQIAGWNGLVLSALATASTVFPTDEAYQAYRRAGTALATYLRTRLWDGKHLHRATSNREWIGEATLDDYAFVAKGLRDWALVVGSEQDLRLSRRLVTLAWDRFHSDDGWRLWPEPPLPAVPAEPILADNPLPSASSILLHLTLLDGDPALASRARQALNMTLSTVARSPFFFATQAILYLEFPPTS